jgi:hypothetical protein
MWTMIASSFRVIGNAGYMCGDNIPRQTHPADWRAKGRWRLGEGKEQLNPYVVVPLQYDQSTVDHYERVRTVRRYRRQVVRLRVPHADATPRDAADRRPIVDCRRSCDSELLE